MLGEAEKRGHASGHTFPLSFFRFPFSVFRFRASWTGWCASGTSRAQDRATKAFRIELVVHDGKVTGASAFIVADSLISDGD